MTKILEILSCEKVGGVIRFLRTEYFFPYKKLSLVYKGVGRLRGDCTDCQKNTKILENLTLEGPCIILLYI